jgi:DNA-binding CsgD family transcriptional regulator
VPPDYPYLSVGSHQRQLKYFEVEQGFRTDKSRSDAPVAGVVGAPPNRPPIAASKGSTFLLDVQRGSKPVRRLTRREQQVLALVTRGLANKHIARQLGITERTVKAHLTSVFQQLGVSDRTHAALWLRDHPVD